MKTMRGCLWLQVLALLVMLPSLVMMPSAVRANPSDGVVSAGAAEIIANELDPAFLQIIQSSDKAIINWQDFSIGAGEHTQFIQPSQFAAVLNRVVSGNSSVIAGMLSANGKVIVVNQNGIVVTSSGVVDAAGGVVLSTLGIADGDFMNGMDDSFLGTTADGVINYGTIKSAGGDVILLGNFVDNQGIIGAPDGVVALGAGGNIVVHAQGESKISIMGAGVAADTGVNNSGTITGAAAELKAHGNVYALAINNSGMIRASGSQTINGRVLLISRSADGETGGNIENSGEIKANNADGSGGFVSMQGGTINAAAGSVIDVGGAVNGGSVTIIGQDANGEVNLNGTINAAGGTGEGGVIMATGAGNVNVGADAVMNADGASGGLVSIDGAVMTTMAGTITALGNVGQGGTTNVTGANVVVAVQASMDVSGLTGGGQINVGGGFRGADDSLRNSDSTVVGGLAHLKADAVNTGDAGTVVIWSDGDTIFGGEISARAMGEVGRGGFAEISGKHNLTYMGGVDASSMSGDRGTVLFDSGDITVGSMTSSLPIAGINAILDTNTNVTISTQSGDIIFESLLGNFRDVSVQWNTDADLGIFASGDVRFNNSVRTAGAGSVNVIAGWTGVETAPQILANGPEAAWNDYVNGAAAGSFGGGSAGASGNVYINDAGNDRGVMVGSRYGNTNVAANNIFLTGASSGSGGYAQLGFKDNGQVFRMRQSGSISPVGNIQNVDVYSGSELMVDVNGDPVFLADGITQATYAAGDPILGVVGSALTIPAFYTGGETVVDSGGVAVVDHDGNVYTYAAGTPILDMYGDTDLVTVSHGAHPGKPLVGMVGVNEYMVNGEVEGVRMFNDLSADGTNLLGDATNLLEVLLPYADGFGGTSTNSNWWWRSLDGKANGSSGIGDNLPEMGAGISDELLLIDDFGGGLMNAKADINIEARGALVMRAGNAGESYNSNYVQVGHGGNARGWSNVNLTRATNGERAAYSMNWGSGNSFTTAIARLAPVYGDINIRTGLVLNEVLGMLEPTSASGLVWLQAVYSGDITGRLNNNYAQIGHMGVGQGGSAIGDINVLAGGAVEVQSGTGRRSSAIIGHAIDDTDDLRRGKGLVGVTGQTPDGKFGGGQQKQFRVFTLNSDQTSAATGRGDLVGYTVPLTIFTGTGTGIYGGNTVVTGAGADVFSNFEGDITVDSVTGDVSVKGFVGDPNVARERVSNSPARIGHGALAASSEYRLNVMGDITVNAARDIFVIAGNGRMSSAQIGLYGGAREDTNDYAVGNIIVNAGRNLVIEGGGRTVLNPRNEGGASTDYQAFALIGHGGRNADSQFKNGDITVTVGGDLTMTSGAYGGAFVQIGHGGEDSEGQVGGEYTRAIMIADDSSNGVRNVAWTTSNMGVGEVQLDPTMTANVVVTVDGDIVMEHLPTNNPLVVNTDKLDNPNTPIDESDPANMRMDDAYTLIGHGGANTTDSSSNVLRQYRDKTGDVTVAAGGSLTMLNGGGNNGWYTRIGAGATRGDRQSNGREALFSGNVMVDVGTDLMMDANWAPNVYSGVPIPPGGNGAFSDFASANPVAIGNGGTRNGDRINFAGDVIVTVGGDLEMQSGKGLEASYAQIGNGGAGTRAPNTGVDDTGKFTGYVTVDVTGSLTMTANPDGVVYMRDPTLSSNFGQEVTSSYVLIGNGGAYWETAGGDVATMDGDVRVTVGVNLNMKAGSRTQAPEQDGDNNWATLLNSFVQIGNANSGAGASSDGPTGTANGNIYVQVGNDLKMSGGQGELGVETPNVGAYAQIGNGGPEMDGPITGDIEVKVGNKLTTIDSMGVGDSYVKIGHGDWMRDTPSRSGTGSRGGDISINVGNTADFDRALIGHRDSAVSSGPGIWNVVVGVSRANPFYGGTGQLIANNGSVFSSGTDIVLGQLRFYMPGRSNNLLSMDTVLNGVNFAGYGVGVSDFDDTTRRIPRGVIANFQRDDEIYLQPDWWSGNDGAAGASAFPLGSLAEVNDPGGLDNLKGLSAGVLGGGTGVNAHGEEAYLGLGLNLPNALNYSLYYDAIEDVNSLTGGGGAGFVGAGFALPVETPALTPIFVPDVDLFNFLFFSQAGADLFGYTERDDLIMGDVVDGGGDTLEGLEAQKPRSFFGVANRELTTEEEEHERRRRARYQYQVGNGGRVFWTYDVSSRQYSSARLFGTPSGPSVSP